MQANSVAIGDLSVNDQGFLVNFDDWTPEVAKAMAQADNLELQECHWIALNYLRDYYATYDIPPAPRTVISDIGQQLDPRCDSHTMDRLFPKGGCKQACRLAGLPESYCFSC